jgi:hypothetical protein
MMHNIAHKLPRRGVGVGMKDLFVEVLLPKRDA